jgi:hypothetical protein
MPGAQIPTSVTRLESMLGYQAVSLTNFGSSALSAIAAGSKVEIAGAFFTFTVDEAIEASTWTSIVTGNTAYIALTPAGVAGSQTVTAAYTATAPVWSTSKQGWYASAGSSTRVIATVYKNEATSQLRKRIFEPRQDYAFRGIVELITTGSGNWTVPSDITRIRVTCVGGGGGGGYTTGAGVPYAGGGGGGGTNISLVSATTISVIPGSLIAYSVGGGGAGGTTAASAVSGSDTTFAGATTGLGGAKGLNGGTTAGDGLGGLGGAGSGKSDGQSGSASGGATFGGTGGNGGGAGGRGGARGNTKSDGQNGSIGGGGGGGGGDGGAIGGNGGSGIIIIEY